MNASLNEVMVHVHETLDAAALRRLEDEVRQDAGVISVGHPPDRSHMIMVVYDTEATRAARLLDRFRQRGLHARIVGL